ncbi:MAG: SAM-dependent methyltransferase, partial [Alphaproteobacteria bacterium]|nr:SAM-dependent methyltransferase [Alphaproteobacteria bacterium]
MKRIGYVAVALVLFVVSVSLTFAPSHAQDKQPAREPDVIFVPTPYEVIDKMFELADIRPGEIVYDLG